MPNTVSHGLNADKDLSVAAVAIVGRLDAVDPVTGVAENDLYSFEGKAGDLINVEVMSSSLTRYAADSIDAVVRVFDASGNVSLTTIVRMEPLMTISSNRATP